MSALSGSLKMSANPLQPRMTRRSLAKLQTREKVLQAARQLFCERGYDASTIRDIALAAGMSTGAVFASFSDKSDLFDEIINQDAAAMVGPMRAAAAGATTLESLVGLFEAAYRFQAGQIPLVQAWIAASWTRSADSEKSLRDSLQPIFVLIDEVLDRGVQRGELAQTADLQLLSGMLWDLYIAGYRGAAHEGWTVESLTADLKKRIGLILKGATT
jgi:AcrR family transcriptional regulator